VKRLDKTYVAFKIFSGLKYGPENSLGESYFPVWTRSESRRRWATNTTGPNL